jgi:choline dehydrogenase-like flavoprotein
MVRRVSGESTVVVIGSGPPGSAAVHFLAMNGISVMVLEAGSRRSALGLTVRVRGFTVAKWRRPLLRRTAGVVLTGDETTEFDEDISPGGLTNHWSCAVPRFSPEDFRDADRAGEEFRWPIGYDDLEPWYDQVEPLLHVAGDAVDTMHVPAGRVRTVWKLRPDWSVIVSEAERQGRNVLAIPYVYGSDTTVTLSGTVFNSFIRLVRPLERARRVTVRYDAAVERLEWSKEKGRVETVVYRDTRTGEEHRVRCRAVVLAAGAINTARILLASESPEFPRGLGNTEDVLGRYLHDHPLAKLVIELGHNLSAYPAAYISRRKLERDAPLLAAQCAQWSGAAIFAKSILARTPGRLPWIGFSVFGTMHPDKKNSITLPGKNTRNGRSRPLALHIQHPSESIDVLNETRDEIVEILSRAGLGPRVAVWKVERPGNAKHFAGTCRMHASPRFGMLNGLGRLHAVPNVVVADSAAFTTGPEKNPVLTAMALAARASSLLAADLRAGKL